MKIVFCDLKGASVLSDEDLLDKNASSALGEKKEGEKMMMMRRRKLTRSFY